jgi:glycosyltransferase involved in cell wall biosynthesis
MAPGDAASVRRCRTEKAKILFLTNRFAPAGAETFLLERIRVLDRTRFEPVVAQLREGGDLLPEFQALGIRCLTLGAPKRFDLDALVRLYRLVRQERVDILEAHVWYACLVARLVGLLARIPVIITNEQDIRAGMNTVRRDVLWLGDLTTRLSTACVHITTASHRSFVQGTPRLFQGQVVRRTIPNGIDVEAVACRVRQADPAEKRRELGLEPNDFVVGNVARLQPAKGHRYLLEGFAEVRRRVPGARLVLVGWGVLEDELKRQAESLGISAFTRFVGRRLDVPDLLATFDVFAFSSIHEGQGIAILEAMAARVPVVATDIDGIPDMVRPGHSGLLVHAQDAPALAEGILRVHSEPGLADRLRAGAYQVAEQEFSVASVARQYEQLYDELLEGHPRMGAPFASASA